jgi:hypothetical protein
MHMRQSVTKSSIVSSKYTHYHSVFPHRDMVPELVACNNMAFPAPRMNYRYLTPGVTYRGYLAQITTSLDFKH